MFAIPAFWFRQTDLVVAAAKTGKPLTLKRTISFTRIYEICFTKVIDSGNDKYSDYRGKFFRIYRFGGRFQRNSYHANYAPVILDVTPSLQQPKSKFRVTGGRPELIETIAKAGIAVGTDGIFIEHIQILLAKSDGANMQTGLLDDLLGKLTRVRSNLFYNNRQAFCLVFSENTKITKIYH